LQGYSWQEKKVVRILSFFIDMYYMDDSIRWQWFLSNSWQKA